MIPLNLGMRPNLLKRLLQIFPRNWKMSDSADLDDFVGLNSRVGKIQSLLSLGLHDVQIVGIWGMGGIGKTTIASAVSHQISRDFQGKCFMRNVRQESNKKGVIHDQDEVISEVLG